VQTGLHAASETAQRLADQVNQTLGVTGECQEQPTPHPRYNPETLTEVSTVLTRGLQDFSREWTRVFEERLEKNLEGFNALTRCRSVTDVVAVQTALVRESLHQTIKGTLRIAEVSNRVGNELAQALERLQGQDLREPIEARSGS
jgi:hypothetical protein